MTSTAATRALDVDPDIEQAIADLEPYANRLRHAEQRILRLDPVIEYRKYIGTRAEASQCRDQISLRAKRIVIAPAALVLIMDQAHRLATAMRRKPRREQLRRALQDHAGTMAQRADRARAKAAQATADLTLAERDLAAAEEAARRYTGVA